MFLDRVRILAWALLLAGWAGAASAGEVLPGPYSGTVERVVDGDTLAVRVTGWLQQELTVLVRVRGIDAPELRARCASEKTQAQQAADALERLVANGAVVLTRIEGDKYFGRVVADVATPDGKHVAAALMAAGLARDYDGAARKTWCAIGSLPRQPRDVAQAGLGGSD